jgi:phosphoserine phosphatase
VARGVAAGIRGIVAFDLDGTLLRGPTVCELLAERLGRLPRMRQLEALSTEAEIAGARAEMASWYRGVAPAELRRAVESARWAPGAQQGIALLRAHAVEVVVASITWEFAARWLTSGLGVSHVLGTKLEEDGRIAHVWPGDKGRWLENLASELKPRGGRIAAIGDSPSDEGLLAAASLRFYLGEGAPPPLPGVVHRPGADVEALAREILAAWDASAEAPEVR